ncbi:MAG TPA: hypothetical protein VF175_07540, partial [Lacipirellula sp.]
MPRPCATLLILLLASTLSSATLRAAPLNIAIDIDTSVTGNGSGPGPASPVQPGFQSWDISHFDSQFY